MSKSLITVGEFTYGHDKLNVLRWGEGANLIIGKFCSIAENSTIFLGGNHRTDWITTYPFGHINGKIFNGSNIVGHPSTNGDVNIGNDVWIGRSATIMSGITIGHGAVIAANANVIKDVAPYEVVGGNPATTLKFRFSNDIIKLLLILRWWDLSVDQIRELAPNISKPPTVELLESLIKRYTHD
jgi:acetyltransferase-like isoleucine patch superfamily enzyme